MHWALQILLGLGMAVAFVLAVAAANFVEGD
jgi:hypothetical protein